MGFALTLLYLLTAYLSPKVLFGDLAQYHLEIIIAILALLASLPSLPRSGILRAPQTIAVAGMAFAIVASFIFAGLLREAPSAFYDFLPDSLAFFLIALNCRTRLRLQIVVAVLVCASVFIMIQGSIALRNNEILSPYLYDQGYEGNHILRLRGLGLVNDPNDLAQVLVSLIPCTFFSWKPKKLFWNLLFVLIPCSVLLVGVFLTHSRGSLVALMAVIAIAVYRKFGAIPAAIMAGATFALSSALSWSGGRDISVQSGEDRMDAWSTGLELIKSHPIFGVGYRRFVEYNNITAHNTVVVCAAELGFVGFFFWVLFVVSSIRQGATLRSRPQKKPKERTSFAYAPNAMQYQTASGPAGEGFLVDTMATATPTTPDPRASSGEPMDLSNERKPKQESEASIRQMAWIMVICFAGFLAAGWFLSRAYVMWLFMYGGMVQAVYRMAVDRGMTPPPISFPRLLRLTFIVSVALLLLVYVILRVKRFIPGA